MTKPLIDRDELSAVVATWTQELEPHITQDVLNYLRAVLTPEALDPPGDVPVFVQIGDDWVKIADLLHRRIFGEDK